MRSRARAAIHLVISYSFLYQTNWHVQRDQALYESLSIFNRKK